MTELNNVAINEAATKQEVSDDVAQKIVAMTAVKEKAVRKSVPRYRAIHPETVEKYKAALVEYPLRAETLDILIRCKISLTAFGGLVGLMTQERVQGFFMGVKETVEDSAVEYVLMCIEGAELLGLLPCEAGDVQKNVEIGKRFIDLNEKYQTALALIQRLQANNPVPSV